MKDVFKGVAIKILSIIVIIAILGGVAYGGYRYMKTKAEANKGHETVNNIEVIKEKLASTAELNTYSYLCTDVITRADSKTFKDWKIPFTEKSFIVQYDGTVKAGISDLTKAQVTEEGEKIVVKLPEVEITSAEIDNDSFEKSYKKVSLLVAIPNDKVEKKDCSSILNFFSGATGISWSKMPSR